MEWTSLFQDGRSSYIFNLWFLGRLSWKCIPCLFLSKITWFYIILTNFFLGEDPQTPFQFTNTFYNAKNMFLCADNKGWVKNIKVIFWKSRFNGWIRFRPYWCRINTEHAEAPATPFYFLFCSSYEKFSEGWTPSPPPPTDENSWISAWFKTARSRSRLSTIHRWETWKTFVFKKFCLISI